MAAPETAAAEADLRAEIARLDVEIAELRTTLTYHARDPQLHPPRPLGVPAEDLAALTARVPQKPPLTLAAARSQFGANVVDAALSARLIHRARPEGGVVVLVTERPLPSSIDVPEYLRETVTRIQPDGQAVETPRAYATLTELRTVFNKNTITAAVDAAVANGDLAVGTLQTARSGRPRRVFILADQPKPTHVEGLPVRWLP